MRSASVWELAIIAVFLVLLMGGGLNTAYADATVVESVDNESLTVDYANDSELGAENVLEYDNLSVFNTTGDELVAGTDYDFNASAGAINWTNTANTTDGDDASATYDYTTRQAAARVVGTLLAPTGTVLGWLLMAVALGAVLMYGTRLGGGF